MFVVNTSPNIAVNVQEGRLLSRRQRGWWTMWLYSIFLRSMRSFSAHSIRRSSDTSGHDTELKRDLAPARPVQLTRWPSAWPGQAKSR